MTSYRVVLPSVATAVFAEIAALAEDDDCLLSPAADTLLPRFLEERLLDSGPAADEAEAEALTGGKVAPPGAAEAAEEPAVDVLDSEVFVA